MINYFGLDIGAETIKIAQVSREGNNYRLVSAGISKTPGSGLTSDSEKDFISIAEEIKKLKIEAKIKANEVVASIPERDVFSQVIEVPKMSKDELAEAIPWEAEHLIPQPISEVNLDWQILDEGKQINNSKMKVLLIAVPTNLVNKYIKVLKMADLLPLALETETLAMIRSLNPLLSNSCSLLLNLGMKSSEIIIVKKGDLYLSHSLSSGGGAITRVIGSSLNLELSVAEEYKKNYGLSLQLEGKVAQAAEPILAIIIDEVKKAIRFFEEKEQDKVRLLVLTGGASLLPGLSEYFTKATGLEVQISDPFSLISAGSQLQPVLKQNSPLFTVAVGLAMREG